jgi:hypothetical protein
MVIFFERRYNGSLESVGMKTRSKASTAEIGTRVKPPGAQKRGKGHTSGGVTISSQGKRRGAAVRSPIEHRKRQKGREGGRIAAMRTKGAEL